MIGLVVIVLAVNSTTPSLGIAVAQDRRVLGEVILPPSREHLENVAVIIKDLTDALSMSLSDLSGFGVCIGPGSFSGIRVGIAVVKGMALALHKPVAGVSALELLAWQALREGDMGVAIVDARRGQCYTALYLKKRGQLELVHGPMLATPDELTDLVLNIPHRLVMCGDHLFDDLTHSLSHLERSHVEAPLPGACAMLAEERLMSGEIGDVHGLAPLYIRRSDAETNRHGRGQTPQSN